MDGYIGAITNQEVAPDQTPGNMLKATALWYEYQYCFWSDSTIFHVLVVDYVNYV